MQKEFIPYKQAVELKQLGFDEPCMGYRDGGGHLMIKEMPHCVISAPTYSQAFKWFREKHRLYHVINMFGDWDKPQYSYIVSGKTMGNPAHMWYYEDVDSYEQAELICLNKLIEIIKNKFGGLEK